MNLKSLKSKVGPTIIVLIAILTIVMWVIVRQGTFLLSNYDIATHSLGQIAGLVGMTLFSLTFLLTTRLKFVENAFNGLDKMYKIHHLMGATAFVLLLFHPLLLVIKFIPGNMKQAAIYLWPSSSWGVNFGIAALGAMTILIVLTLYVNMKYPNWKLSHKFMGIVYFVAIAHVFLVTTDITFYPLLRTYMIILSIIGGVSYIYGSYLRHIITKRYVYAVESVVNKDKITIIELKPRDGGIRFDPGQFVFVRFLNISSEQHPFTIASSPSNKNLRFAIKDLGDYTSKLNKLKKGDLVEIEGPHGRFGSVKSNNKVFIAGGIGITPFLSMIGNFAEVDNKEKIDLYYCTRNREEAVFLDELNEVTKNREGFRVIPWYSNEKGKIDADVVDKISGVNGKDFLICGPVSLMHSLKGQLIVKGVKKSNIHMEEFNIK